MKTEVCRHPLDRIDSKLAIKMYGEEYDRLIKEDFNDISKWNLKSVIGYKQNRLISYPCNYFHSKYPNKSWKEGRVVLVMFYKSKNSLKI